MVAPKPPRFFKAFVASSTSHRLRLEIPVSYVRHIKVNAPQFVYLTGPSQVTCPVELVRANGRLYLQQGWSDFVKCHSLEDSDTAILSFKYDGRLNFKVQIFDGCLRTNKLAFRAAKRTRGLNNTAAAPRINTKRAYRDETEEHGAADSHADKRLSFVKTLRLYSVSGPTTLKVPAWFVREHCPTYRDKVELFLENTQGQQWPVNLFVRSHNICGGWTQFVHDNHLEEGDTCTFEVVEKLKMLVHISRQRAPSQVNQLKRLATPEQPLMFGTPRKRQFSGYVDGIVKPTTSIRLTKRGTKQDKFFEGAQKIAEVSSQYNTSLTAEKHKVESDANDWPTFVVPMRASNICSSILLVVSEFFSNYQSKYGKKAHIVLQNQDGKQWPVDLCCYGNRGILSGGWSLFVRDNQIKENDSCKFELVNEREMHVQISRLSTPSQKEQDLGGLEVTSEHQISPTGRKSRSAGHDDGMSASLGLNSSSENDEITRKMQAATEMVLEELQEQREKTDKATEEITQLRAENRRIMQMLQGMNHFGADSSH